jgi:hypothetical protein
LTGKFKIFHPAIGTEEFDQIPIPSKIEIFSDRMK